MQDPRIQPGDLVTILFQDRPVIVGIAAADTEPGSLVLIREP